MTIINFFGYLAADASFIHLVFVNIHPFNDGNGRAANQLNDYH
ncbi:MAG TPA: Fic family protein [Cytophagales bacterium]|nr:Fic family protein [Cytophagales bacterium]